MRVVYVSAWGLQNTDQNTPEMKLAKEIASRGSKLTCITYASSRTKIEGEMMGRGSLRIKGLPRFVRRLKGPTLLMPRVRPLTKVTQEFKLHSPDIWHLHHPSSLSIVASLTLSMGRDAPVVFTSHDPLVASGLRPVVTIKSPLKMLGHRPSGKIPEVLVRSIPYNVSNRIIALTNFEKEVLISCGLQRRRIVVIPHGVALIPRRNGLRKRLGLENKFVILTVARFVAQKGHRYLIDSIPSVIRRFDAHYLMVGRESAILPSLREYSKRLNVDKNITFLTSLSDDDLSAAYTESDIFVLPSLYESFGMVLLEAMAAGKPVVATNVGGIAEIVEDGKTGIVVPPADPESLSIAVQSLLRSGELRSKLGEEAQRNVLENYRWSTVADRTEAVYEDALKA